MRLALLIGVAVMVFSQINGVNMLLIYAPSIFKESGVADSSMAILNSVFVNIWITACTVVAFWLTARFGRRPILIVGTLGMAAGHLLFYATFLLGWPVWVVGAAMFLATGAFTLGLAPLSWVLLSELFPNRVRARAMSMATCLMFFSSYCATQTFPIAIEWFKTRYGHPGGTFLIFAAICMSCSVFVWKMVPETKDQTLEQIGQYWLRQDRSTRAAFGPDAP